MKIYGLSGKKRSGKDTAGLYIQELTGLPIFSFADPIKEASMILFNLTKKEAYGIEYDREQIHPYWGVSVREIHQKLGTDYGRNLIHDDVWIRRAALTLQDPIYKKGFICTDVRFNNEGKFIRNLGGKLLNITRPSTTTIDTHISENGLSNNLIDIRITNNSSLKIFKQTIKNTLLLWE